MTKGSKKNAVWMSVPIKRAEHKWWLLALGNGVKSRDSRTGRLSRLDESVSELWDLKKNPVLISKVKSTEKDI